MIKRTPRLMESLKTHKNNPIPPEDFFYDTTCLNNDI